MTKQRYTLVNPEMVGEWVWSIHKVGCKGVKADLDAHGGTKEVIRVDLDNEDDVMDACDIDDLGYNFADVRVHDCTGWQPKPKPAPRKPKATKKVATRPAKAKTGVPTSKPKKNGQATDEARAKAQALLEDLIEKIVAARGEDNVGEDAREEWDAERLDTCNDYVYDLAVEVRKLREQGEAWWRIAHTLMLPGAGASAVQGKTGAAFARRLWERAWGQTYSGEKAPRETKARKEERAITAPTRPYFADDELEQAIIDAIAGKSLEWVINLPTPGGAVVSAQSVDVHGDPRTIQVKQGPQGRYVEFFEAGDGSHHHITTSGPRRSVYIKRITRVGL